MRCKFCKGVIHDEGGVMVDATGGDVCGHGGGNEPHETLRVDAMRLEVENHEASDFENWAIVDADSDNGDVIALVPKTDDETRPELAIANLLSAAPDLLAACEAAYQLATCDRNDGDDVAAMLRAAIAKALGNV